MIERINRPERLDFLAMGFTCQATSPFVLENAYSDLHGGFGLMLHTHFPLVYRDLFGEQQDSGMVRAYVLRPDRRLLQPVDTGQEFAFDLILYGPAARHAAACAEALGQLGINGITRARHRFAISRIERRAPEGALPIWSHESGWQVRNMFPVAAIDLLKLPFDSDPWQLHLESPTAIKTENNLLRSGLSPHLFFERLLGRAQLLATQQAGGALLDGETKRLLLGQARNIQILRNESEWMAQSRYSARQGQRSEFGGLMGKLLLTGQPGHLGGWLHLASWLHVGSKTSFGLGQIHACTAA